jgi:hypothetical protein
MADYSEMNAVYAREFDPPYPCTFNYCRQGASTSASAAKVVENVQEQRV